MDGHGSRNTDIVCTSLSGVYMRRDLHGRFSQETFGRPDFFSDVVTFGPTW